MEVDEEELDGPPWADLPSAVIEKIYTLLDRRDQARMSSVCRNWHKEYSLPSLWRRMEFCFPDYKHSANLCPGVMTARRFGALFHYVEIRLVLEKGCNLRRPFISLKQVEFFLKEVTRQSQLLSLSFIDVRRFLYLTRSKHFARSYTVVYQAILNLLTSQKRLQKVEFRRSEFKKADAAELVKAVIMNNWKTLKFLHISALLRETHRNKFQDVILDDDLNYHLLMNLEVLEINYTHLFESMMLSFYEYSSRVDMRGRNGRLRQIILNVDYEKGVNYMGVNPLTWQYFMKIFPYLTVDLKVRCYRFNLNFSHTFIVPHMPLRKAAFYCVYPEKQFGLLLRHVASCKINECLEVLVVHGWINYLDFAADLIAFTEVCPKLKMLEFEPATVHPAAEAIGAVLRSWLENRPPSLNLVKMSMNYFSNFYYSENEFELRHFDLMLEEPLDKMEVQEEIEDEDEADITDEFEDEEADIADEIEDEEEADIADEWEGEDEADIADEFVDEDEADIADEFEDEDQADIADEFEADIADEFEADIADEFEYEDETDIADEDDDEEEVDEIKEVIRHFQQLHDLYAPLLQSVGLKFLLSINRT